MCNGARPISITQMELGGPQNFILNPVLTKMLSQGSQEQAQSHEALGHWQLLWIYFEAYWVNTYASQYWKGSLTKT